MGSARHAGPHLEALRAQGLSEDEVARVQTPVGLDIGARTPEEIALSILAGLVAARNGPAPAGWKDPRGVRVRVRLFGALAERAGARRGRPWTFPTAPGRATPFET